MTNWNNIKGTNYYINDECDRVARWDKKNREYIEIGGTVKSQFFRNYQMRVDGKIKTFNLHHLSWLAFVDPDYRRGPGTNIEHKDGDLTNNRPENLHLVQSSVRRNATKEHKGKEKPTHCGDCKRSLCDVIRGARGRCKTCYQRWRMGNGFTKCQGCGIPTPTKPLIPYCRMCRKLGNIKESGKDVHADFNLLRNKLEKRLYKKRIDQKQNIIEPSNDIRERTKYVLLKFKYGNYSLVDIYKLISVYIDIWGTETAIDNYDLESQLIFMLKRLKMFWDDKLINI
jgi:hypothetical protein